MCACLLAAPCGFHPKIFKQSHLLNILTEDKCHYGESGKKKVSCWRAPAQISYLLISSGQGQEVRQRRDVACWHCGAQGPTRRQSSRLQFSIISSPSAAEGWCRSHSTVCTQMHTQSRYAEEYKTQHRQGILTKLRKGLGWLHTHIK